jgi:hypothetical protein
VAFVSEDSLDIFTKKQFTKFLNYVAPLNSRSKLKRIASRRFNSRLSDEYTDYSGGEDTSGGSEIDAEDVGAIVDLVDTVIGWFDGGDSSSGSGGAPTQVGTYVGVNGMVYCVRNIGGGIVGFGLDPSGKRLIAFSNPQEVLRIFQDLPPNAGGSLPFFQLPSAVNSGLVNYALSHPNKIVRFVPGTTNQFEVNDPVIVQDPGGSTDVLNPDGSGGEGIDDEVNEAGMGGILPLLLIGGGILYAANK